MTPEKREELIKLIINRYKMAISHIERFKKAAEVKKAITEEAELPGFENQPMKFGQFENKEFVVMMTDIRNSTGLINQPNGLTNMFVLFYVYAAVVANIVDSNSGTSTEFLGDGVLNLFDTNNGREIALACSMIAARDILFARTNLLNPFFYQIGLPVLNLGIGIDYGITIVTRFGFRQDNDLKAFGTCVYNVSKLCKGFNEIIVSSAANSVWPTGPAGTLQFSPTLAKDGSLAYKVLNP